jgi:hypothetical protein
MRAAGLPDLANDLTGPPDWHNIPASAFYAEDARDFRLLEFADSDMAQSLDVDPLDPRMLDSLASRLDHAERKMAQHAIVNIMRRQDRPAGFIGMKPWLTLFRLHPFRAARLVFGGRPFRKSAVRGNEGRAQRQ